MPLFSNSSTTFLFITITLSISFRIASFCFSLTLWKANPILFDEKIKVTKNITPKIKNNFDQSFLQRS